MDNQNFIQLGDASKNAGSMLSVKLDDTWLQPPNLKIWAERKYTPEKGIVSKDPNDKEKHYLIGQEGAALTTDELVEVYTEWLDEEGRPLPEGLGADDGEQYGLSMFMSSLSSSAITTKQMKLIT